MKKIDVVVSYWASEGEKNVDKVLAHFSEDAEFTAPGGMRLDGRGEIRKFYEGMTGGYASMVVRPTHWIEQEDFIAVEYDCDMVTHEGEKRFAQGHNFFKINPKGEITLLHCYYNPNDF